MSPEAERLAARLRDRWDELAGLVADVPAESDETLELLRRTGMPIAHRARRAS